MSVGKAQDKNWDSSFYVQPAAIDDALQLLVVTLAEGCIIQNSDGILPFSGQRYSGDQKTGLDELKVDVRLVDRSSEGALGAAMLYSMEGVLLVSIGEVVVRRWSDGKWYSFKSRVSQLADIGKSKLEAMGVYGLIRDIDMSGLGGLLNAGAPGVI